MEYSINQLAKMAGITTRTLRHYDDIDLLKPVRKAQTGYRIYSSKEVDRLQQIMFYKHLGVELAEIKSILDNPQFDPLSSLESHLSDLTKEQERLNKLINNLTLTIKNIKGEYVMTDKEKFEAFKDDIIKENEDLYGKELRDTYGINEIEMSNKKVKNMSQEQWDYVQKLSENINITLKQAVQEGDATNATSEKLCQLHKEWICNFWNSYSKQAHLGLCVMYTQDPRFQRYYDSVIPGGAEFLLKAMENYLK